MIYSPSFYFLRLLFLKMSNQTEIFPKRSMYRSILIVLVVSVDIPIKIMIPHTRNNLIFFVATVFDI